MSWFYNLPVRRKQLLGLFTSEIISVIGLMGVGSILIILGGRNQLIQQAIAEGAVTEIAYNLKIDQMGFGFRGQSDNPSIIRAAFLTANGEQLSPEENSQVRQILQNEITARNIEYATLVDRNGRIIVNANTNRQGQPFDPDGLVTRVLEKPQQIKASSLISWDELQQENPPLPLDFQNRSALIRYTVTPVLDPANQAVIGALVSGDIVNNKLDIAEKTLDAFQNGYSAVYMREGQGFPLATSLDLGKISDFSQAQLRLELDDTQLLEKAIASSDGTAAQRVKVGSQTYSASAKVINNIKGQPVAILVRGTSEASLNALIRNSLQVQLLIAGIALGADFILAVLLGRSIANPIKRLQASTKQFALGNRRLRSDIDSRDEIGQLAQIFNDLANKITQSEQKLMGEAQQQAIQAARSKFLADLAVQIRQSTTVQHMKNLCVEGARDILQADRMLFLEFDGSWNGLVTAEAVGEGWPVMLGDTIHDPCFETTYAQQYQEGRVRTVPDIYQAGLTDCHLELLESYKVRASSVIPILVGNDLMGLLIAHQCEGPRQWAEGDILFLQQIGLQLGVALNQMAFSQDQATQTVQAKFLVDLALQVRQSMKDEELMTLYVEGTRTLLKSDRVLFYEFDDKWEGTMVAESVGDGWPAKLGDAIYDPCFEEKYIQQYREGRIQATPDVYQAGLTDCHLNVLEPYKVRANLVVPVLLSKSLKGLLIVHQCDAPRQWSKTEINFVQQMATQLGYALNQAQLFQQKEWARLEAEDLSNQQRQQKEALQMQLIDLLSDVEAAASGNLTVRADVTAGDIGTVADFFNSIIENLRQVVIQVKRSSNLVNESLEDNEVSMRQLADVALQQAEETTSTLASMDEMIESIQIVAQRAQEAATVAHTASLTAESGEQAMDKTVNTILSLRTTVGETAKKVKRLGEASQQISKVVSLINQIAMQTNLLAINAGIEAARAGEEGQGFAVVAEEVGELAARSSAATQEIEEIVTNIQLETYQVAEAMEMGTTQVVESTQLVEEAKLSLNQIMAVSRQIDQLVGSISNATVSQVKTSEAVSTLMQQIASVSAQSSQSSLHVSSSLQETVAIAQKLQASVDTFVVEDADG